MEMEVRVGGAAGIHPYLMRPPPSPHTGSLRFSKPSRMQSPGKLNVGERVMCNNQLAYIRYIGQPGTPMKNCGALILYLSTDTCLLG